MKGLDEIKARLMVNTTELHPDDWQHDMRRLIARVEKLEAALEEINTIPIREYSVPHLTNIIHKIRPIARTALAEDDFNQVEVIGNIYENPDLLAERGE